MAVIVVTERKVELRNLRSYNEYGLQNQEEERIQAIFQMCSVSNQVDNGNAGEMGLV